MHERRVQGPGGHWTTQQLVSNVPLSPAEAAKLLAQMPVSPQVAPSARNPVVGARTGRPADGLPYGDTHGNTRNRPPKPPEETPDAPAPAEASEAAHPSPAPKAPQAQVDRGSPEGHEGHENREGDEDGRPGPVPPNPHLEEARTLAASYRDLDPALRHVPRPMHAELARLTSHWLEAGHPPAAIRTHILRNLPDDGTPVHRPGGLLRHLLRDVPPPPAPTPVAPPDAPPHAPQQHAPAVTSLSPRLAALRECEGRHVQATLFRPVHDETLCPRCSG
ncbi:hypothetical protein ACICHK_24090 [Streptomyces sp. AHU1]|uniref:hypothetical protein n=1 Tax=Streptomyces sp. AHU1 TaxID=3377215 RepID=UPI0038779303